MSSSSNIFTLPSGPSELCFDKDEFMKKEFSVDKFLHDHRNAASLEVMRDDLGTYLKILRLAMIELINQDYGEFVNLSNRLVGLNRFIDDIQKSVQHVQESIYDIKVLLESVMNEIDNSLRLKKQFVIYKKTGISLVKVRTSIEKLVELIDSDLEGRSKAELSTILERASLELIQSQFHAKYCNDYLDDNKKEKVEELHKKFLDKMRIYFLDILDSPTSSDLEKCLVLYASLDKCYLAERVFQEKVDGYMKTRISENILQNSSRGLAGVYTEILNFISLHMKDILLLTHHTDKVKGFKFLINSYWRDVEQKIEMNLSSIFAPGNPESFYANYKCTKEFLEKFETVLGNESAINDFRQHELTKNFKKRWNLAVYFQIRFQEIAGPLETSCCDPSKQSNLFDLALTNVSMCWADGIYIEELFPKFLKLTLQIISRVCKCVETSLEKESSSTGDTITSFYSYFGINKLINKLPDVCTMVLNRTPKDILQKRSYIDVCFENTRKQLYGQLDQIEIVLVKQICSECETSIRQVSDVPRLYRKTNRDAPSKPSAYIQNVTSKIDSFVEKLNTFPSKERVRDILKKVLSRITERYFIVVQEVLTSVRKTEESLKRLKSLRDKSTVSKNSPERVTMSDDDKIKLQLQLDIIFWQDDISKKGFSKENIDQLVEIVNLIESETKIKISD